MTLDTICALAAIAIAATFTALLIPYLVRSR